MATATEFRTTLDTLGIAQHRVAKWFNVGSRSVRRWQYGERRVPRGVDIVMHLLAAGAVTIEQVEAARMNGNAKPEPPTPVVAKLAPKPAAKAGLTIAELTPKACRWPRGDPQQAGFRFCGDIAEEGHPYCTRHSILAYVPEAKPAARGVAASSIKAERLRPARVMCSPTMLASLREDDPAAQLMPLIPNPIDQNPWAHWRSPMDMMRQG